MKKLYARLDIYIDMYEEDDIIVMSGDDFEGEIDWG